LKRLIFAEPAARDLEGIIDHIAQENPAAAETVYRRIAEAAARLRQFPELGRPGRLPGTRELGVSAQPYLIVYEAGPETVTVLAVFHTSRDLARALAGRPRKPPGQK